MNESDRELVFSQAVKAGKRIYYFDVKQSRNGDRYISITESKKIVEGSYDNPRISFEKHKLFLYKEDYEKFMVALTKTLDVARTGIVPLEETVPETSYAPVSEHTVTESYAAEECKSTLSSSSENALAATDMAQEDSKSDAESFKIDLDF